MEEKERMETTKKRVLHAYDDGLWNDEMMVENEFEVRRLWKDEIMLMPKNELEARIRLPGGERSNTTKEKTERERSNMTIEESAQICRQTFNECLTYFDMLSPKQQSAIEDQLGRFSIWAFSIGVFASYRASLDYRLRDADEIQRLIRRLLQTLNEHVEQYLSYLRPLDTDLTTKGLNQHGLTSAINDDLDSAICDISEEIDLLHQLSNTIRKASRETHTLKAATSFVIKDEEGNDYGSTFRDLFAFELIRWRFPECDEEIIQRLAAAMLLRRKRILYRRLRYGGFPSSNSASSAPKKSVPSIEQAQISTLDTQNDNIQAPVPEQGQEQIDAKSQANTATTLHMEQWKRASAPSVVSRPNTIRLSDQERLEFPPPPKGPILQKLKERKEYWIAKHNEELLSLDNYLSYKQYISDLPLETDYDTWRHNHISDLNDELEERIENDLDACYKGNMEVICPYCCSMLSSAIVMNNHQWIDHVKHDLDPYVCLFKTCDTADTLYNHSQDWLKHMRQHKLRKWRCAAKSHGVLLFEDQTEYEEHMRTKHKNTESQLSVLVERGSRSSGPIFDSCPLCGTSDFDISVEEHVAVHLRYLALKSLPFTDDGDDDEGSDEAAIISEEMDRESQGTIAADPDYGTPLNFEETDSTPMPYDEPETLHIAEEPSQDVPQIVPGVRKRTASLEIPKERTLSNIDQLIAQSTNEKEIKELKQQKRLLRNRQAALDHRQRKKVPTEKLEEETEQFVTAINDPEEALNAEARLSEAAATRLLQPPDESLGLDYTQETMTSLLSDRVVEDFLKDESSGSQAGMSSSAPAQNLPASSTRRIGEMVPSGISTSEIGAVDAPPPHQPRVLPPPPPDWLLSGLNEARRAFPNGKFSALMLYSAVDTSTMMRVVATNTDHTNPKLKYQFLPRIQCLDCPEELHVPGPGMSVRHFRTHLLENQHTQRLEERVRATKLDNIRAQIELARSGVTVSQPKDEEGEKYEAACEYQAERSKRQNTPENDVFPTEETSGQHSTAVESPNRANSSDPDQSLEAAAAQQPNVVEIEFKRKLYNMLGDPSLQHVISWSDEGFVISPTSELAQALAKYFKHTNISSFVRQLNMYGFRKVTDIYDMSSPDSVVWEFTHENFKRGESIEGQRTTKDIIKPAPRLRRESLELAEKLKRNDAPKDDMFPAKNDFDQDKVEANAVEEPVEDQTATRKKVWTPTIETPRIIWVPGPCTTCKRRYLKCDQRRPFCAKCENSGRKCGGYFEPSIIIDEEKGNVHIEATETTEKRGGKLAEAAKTATDQVAQQPAKDVPISIPEKEPIKFKDAVGRKFSFPFHLCNTWKGMEDLIRQSFLHIEVIGPHVVEGHYDIIGPNGERILPEYWESVIQPGWSVTMHMWPIPDDPKNPQITKPIRRRLASINSVKSTNKSDAAMMKRGSAPEKEHIKFKDILGRTFSFPFALCNTRQGIRELIRQAFLGIESFETHVAEGYYHLIGPNGRIPLEDWESVVQPGWTVTMKMWPMLGKPTAPAQATKDRAADAVSGEETKESGVAMKKPKPQGANFPHVFT